MNVRIQRSGTFRTIKLSAKDCWYDLSSVRGPVQDVAANALKLHTTHLYKDSRPGRLMIGVLHKFLEKVWILVVSHL